MILNKWESDVRRSGVPLENSLISTLSTKYPGADDSAVVWDSRYTEEKNILLPSTEDKSVTYSPDPEEILSMETANYFKDIVDWKRYFPVSPNIDIGVVHPLEKLHGIYPDSHGDGGPTATVVQGYFPSITFISESERPAIPETRTQAIHGIMTKEYVDRLSDLTSPDRSKETWSQVLVGEGVLQSMQDRIALPEKYYATTYVTDRSISILADVWSSDYTRAKVIKNLLVAGIHGWIRVRVGSKCITIHEPTINVESMKSADTHFGVMLYSYTIRFETHTTMIQTISSEGSDVGIDDSWHSIVDILSTSIK